MSKIILINPVSRDHPQTQRSHQITLRMTAILPGYDCQAYTVVIGDRDSTSSGQMHTYLPVQSSCLPANYLNSANLSSSSTFTATW